MRFIKMLLYFIAALLLFILLYFASDAILSRIPAYKKEISDSQTKYTIYLLSNDVHTDLVLPVQTNIVDWRTIFSTENNKSKETNYAWVGIGWGDKGFYLNTPEWKDLTFKTAFVAAVGIGETALHVTYHPEMIENNLCYKIEINEEQYKILMRYVLESLETKDDKEPILIQTTAQYGNTDAFYEALGSYSMFYSCNTWTNNALKKANLPSGIWTVFDKGILRWYGYEK